ncbi:SDR family oxidoreductase [Nocardioides mangrovicus]|uniref:SDR family oxidoreductase n=1 Tax=Nocardioides mangrovicus TaxID=2478913 RepID=A0A3L8P6B7_9ACTN|nr:SDR family NAD(P)-dependent oxidoreductase [Nocardioides mangrovicus]RLV49988.1 SDR family oxidoreductase [Nocardioides mangrovicus]
MTSPHDDAVVLVTGGASGMGAATARHLSAHGARVVVVDLDARRAEDVARSLSGPALGIGADVSVPEDTERYLAAAVEEFGSLDRVFLNAGIGGATPLLEETVERFDAIVAVNLRGVFLGLRGSLRLMREQGKGGAIVVTTSTAALAGSELAAYSAAKHGAWALVRTAAIEGAPFGVRVNAIAPGSIDTPMMRALEGVLGGGEAAARALHATTPLGKAQDRYGTGEEVARLVGFLLGDDAGWITGVTVPVDGGVLTADPYHFPELPA